MGAIMIRCPTTQQLVPVGIDTDKDSFNSLPNVAATPVHCPLCGQEHASTRQAGRRGEADRARQELCIIVNARRAMHGPRSTLFAAAKNDGDTGTASS
jgi:hypothetical protein